MLNRLFVLPREKLFIIKKIIYMLTLLFILGASNNAVAVNYGYNATGGETQWTGQTILPADTLLVRDTAGAPAALTNQGAATINVDYNGTGSNAAGATITVNNSANFLVPSAGTFSNDGSILGGANISGTLITTPYNAILNNGSSTTANQITGVVNLTVNGTCSMTATLEPKGGSTITFASGSVFTLNAGWGNVGLVTGNLNGNFVNNGNFVPNGPGTFTVSGDGSAGNGVISGSGSITIIGKLKFTGTTSNNNLINGGGTLTFEGTHTNTGVISGGLSEVKLQGAAGVVQFNAVNTYNSATTINAGTLRAGISGAFSQNSSVNLGNIAGATLDLNNFNQTIQSLSGGGTTGGNVTLGTATLTISGFFDRTYSGAISGGVGGSLIKAGSSILTLDGTNTYTGITTINAGTLSIGADNNLGAAPGGVVATQLTFGGGTLATTSSFSLNSNRGITLNAGAVIQPATSTTLTYNGIIAGANALTKSGAGTLVLGGANTYTGITTINAGTLSISADNNLGDAPSSVVATQITFGGGTLATTSSFTLNANRGITLNAGAVIQPATSTTLTYNGIIAGANALTKSGAGTLVLGGANTYTGGTTINAGTLQAGGANLPSGRAITVGASGTFNLTTGTAATLGAVTNSGAMTIATNILMPGLTLTNSGNMTVSGVRTLDAATFTSPGTQHYTITNASTNDRFITNSAVNLTNGTIIVTSAFTDSSASWDILQGSSITTSNTTITPPATNAFGTWSSKIENNTLKILFNRQNAFTPKPGGNTEVADVLNAMSNLSVKNAGQTALLAAVASTTTQQQYNDALTALQPSTSSSPASIAMQNVMLNRIETRLANYDSSSSKLAANNQQVAIYTSGDTASDNAMWLSGFGIVAKQNAHDDFQGYRSNVYSVMLGAETKNEFDTIYGLALGVSNADVTAITDTSVVTRVQGINLLAYGAAETKTNEFMEWILGASVNRNKGNRDFSISGTNLNTSAKYTGAVGGAKVNVGKSFTVNDSMFLVPVASLQYMLSHQGEYQETGSVAALRVNGNNNLNLLTVGAGLRLSKMYNNYWHWLDGSRALSAMLTYDAVSPQQISTASFMVGSGNFSMVNSPVRLALNLGADYSLTVRKNSYLQLSYNLQLRSGYYENFLEAKFRYLL